MGWELPYSSGLLSFPFISQNLPICLPFWQVAKTNHTPHSMSQFQLCSVEWRRCVMHAFRFPERGSHCQGQVPLPGCAEAASMLHSPYNRCWLIHLLGTCQASQFLQQVKPLPTVSTPKTSNSCTVKINELAPIPEDYKVCFHTEGKDLLLTQNVYLILTFICLEIKNYLEQENHLGNAEEFEMIFYNSLWSQAKNNRLQGKTLVWNTNM